MRIKKLKNNSLEKVEVKHKDGKVTFVPPDGVLENVDAETSSEILAKTTVTLDLGEINEASSPKHTKLYD